MTKSYLTERVRRALCQLGLGEERRMTKTYPAERVRRMFRQLGLKELAGGRGGLAVFITPQGRKIYPPLRKKETPFAYLFTLAKILEGQGIVRSKRAFIEMVKNSIPHGFCDLYPATALTKSRLKGRKANG